MAFLKTLPNARLNTPKMYKITLWLDPAEYALFMRRSAEMEAGKISVHKYFKQVMGLENTDEVKARTIAAVARKQLRLHPREERQQIAARRARSPRKAA